MRLWVGGGREAPRRVGRVPSARFAEPVFVVVGRALMDWNGEGLNGSIRVATGESSSLGASDPFAGFKRA